MNPTTQLNQRLHSLDFFRGLVMFLLVAEFSHLFGALMNTDNHYITATADFLFHHAQWEGLHFWDLIQPFFMFIVGVSIPYSYGNRLKKGDSEKQIRNHAFRRAFLLLLFGCGLYCIGPEKIIFQFDNVLAQLSFTYLVAFLLVKKTPVTQVSIALLCILVSDLLYRFFPVVGFDQAFVAGQNFGAWFNILISGYEYGGHWAAFNAVPTAAHTIWGLMAGQLLMRNSSHSDKLKRLLIAAIICLILGYVSSVFTPVIKRISTTSFIFLSGGWTVFALAVCYWIIDIKSYFKKTLVFTVVGVNPLFIYLFASVGGGDLFQKIVKPFTNTLIGGFSPWLASFMLGLIVLFSLWFVCYWLYQKRIFIKI
jgi:predicted acyltransferase